MTGVSQTGTAVTRDASLNMASHVLDLPQCVVLLVETDKRLLMKFVMILAMTILDVQRDAKDLLQGMCVPILIQILHLVHLLAGMV